MSGFKLLAIRPMDGCDPNFLKNLKEGMPYKFYQDIVVKVAKDGDKIELTTANYADFKSSPIVDVVSKNNVIDLYSDKGGPNINISAVVGKNGSGKSALTELFLKAMFDLSVENEIISREKLESQFEKEKEFIEDQIEQLEKSMDLLSRREQNNKGENFFNIVTELGSKMSNYQTRLNNWNVFADKLNNYDDSKLYFELIGQFDNDKPFIIRKSKGEKKIIIDGINLVGEKYSYQNLFYTIFLNYSIYGLNTNEIGEWIDFLYHKNDGYQTPVVINPQKSDGNIDVNIEEELSRYRINRSAVSDGKIIDLNITELKFELKQKVYNFNFHYDWDHDILYANNRHIEPKFKFDLNGKSESDFLNKISGLELDIKDNDFSSAIVKYFLGKLFKTDYLYKLNAFTYDFEKSMYKLNGLSKFCQEEIRNSTSHKLLKLRQVLDLLRCKIELSQELYEFSRKNEWIPFVEFKNKLNNEEEQDLQISFTSIFNVDYKFIDGSTYSKFSSGQKQLVNTIETINYHIRNVVSNNEYKAINIILDEVELYFHPEFQRELIQKMIDSINALNLNSDYSINVLFLTHSPFILSDIPSSNILRLENGKPSVKEFNQTFGANIHDLLATEFFLKDRFIGTFAKNYIIKLIDTINDLETPIKKTEFNHLKCQIEIINEKFIKHKLTETLESKYEDRFNDYDFLIRKKQEEMDELIKRRNDQN